MPEEPEKEKEKFEFTPEGEGLGYISLEQAQVLAMQVAAQDPGDYGPSFSNVPMAFEVDTNSKDEDFYIIVLSVRPQGTFAGTPGREQFFVSKGGSVAHRQVLDFPKVKGRSLFGIGPRVLIPVIGIAAAIVVTESVSTSGADDDPSVLVPAPTKRPTSTPSNSPTPTAAPAPTETRTPVPTITPVPTPTKAPVPTARVIVVTATPPPTVRPTSTRRPTPTRTPRPTPTTSPSGPCKSNETSPPHVFVGTASLDGAAAANGTPVYGIVTEDQVAKGTVSGGQYILVVETCESGGASQAGEFVFFRIGAATADQASVLTRRGGEELNLTASFACDYTLIIPVDVPHEIINATAFFRIGSVWANESTTLLQGGGERLDLTLESTGRLPGSIHPPARDTSVTVNNTVPSFRAQDMLGSPLAHRLPPHLVVGTVKSIEPGTSISAWASSNGGPLVKVAETTCQ